MRSRNPSIEGGRSTLFGVDPDTKPPQPKEVTRALAEALAVETEAPDAWWQAGIDEALAEEPTFAVVRSDGRAAPA